MLEIEKEKQNKKTSFKRGALSKVVIVFFVLCIMFTAVGFADRHSLIQAFVCLTQTILFAVSWMTGMQYIQCRRESLPGVLALIGFLLIIPWLALM